LEIAELQALSRVEKRALELGFQPTDEVRYLPINNFPVTADTRQLQDPPAVENSVEAYVDDVEQPGWWVQKLDILAGWVASN